MPILRWNRRAVLGARGIYPAHGVKIGGPPGDELQTEVDEYLRLTSPAPLTKGGRRHVATRGPTHILAGQQGGELGVGAGDDVRQDQLASQAFDGGLADGDGRLHRGHVSSDHDRHVGGANLLFADQRHVR